MLNGRTTNYANYNEKQRQEFSQVLKKAKQQADMNEDYSSQIDYAQKNAKHFNNGEVTEELTNSTATINSNHIIDIYV